jgi:hypothetical protein
VTQKLPRGIWFDEQRDSPNKYRLRRYRNKKQYLVGYFPTLAEAVAEKEKLDARLGKIPKVRRADKAVAVIPAARFRDLVRAARAEASNND